jgi:hypothetical protein
MNAILGLQLTLATGLSFIGGFMALGYGIFAGTGWGFVVSVWLFLNAHIGWRALGMGIGVVGVRHNGEGAISLAVLTNLGIGVSMILAPPKYSSLWGLLTPLAILIVTITLQVLYEWFLNLVNAQSKR